MACTGNGRDGEDDGYIIIIIVIVKVYMCMGIAHTSLVPRPFPI